MTLTQPSLHPGVKQSKIFHSQQRWLPCFIQFFNILVSSVLLKNILFLRIDIYQKICIWSKINKSSKVYFFHDLKYLNNTPFTAVACAIAELHFMIFSYKLFMRGLLLQTLEIGMYPVHLCYRFIMIDCSCHRTGNYQASL